MHTTFFTRKNLIIITIVIALLLIAGVLIYDPHLTPQSAAKGMYKSDVGCLMEYQDDNFYFKVFNSNAYATAKKSLCFWRSDDYTPYNPAVQRNLVEAGESYYYYGRIAIPNIDNIESIALINTFMYTDLIKPISLVSNDTSFFFVFKLYDPSVIQKKIVFTDYNDQIIATNRYENKYFLLEDSNNETQESYGFYENDNPAFNIMYNNIIEEIINNGKRKTDFSTDWLGTTCFFTATTEGSYYLMYNRLNNTTDDITYSKAYHLYIVDDKIVLSIDKQYYYIHMPSKNFSTHQDYEAYEIENTGIIKEFVDMCAELYKKNAS